MNGLLDEGATVVDLLRLELYFLNLLLDRYCLGLLSLGVSEVLHLPRLGLLLNELGVLGHELSVFNLLLRLRGVV